LFRLGFSDYRDLYYGGWGMNEKKPDGYKVSWGSCKDTWEILVHIVLALAVVYTLYSFFHRGETENYNAEEIKNDGQASGGYRTKLDNLNPSL
jgi:hypothetical protein